MKKKKALIVISFGCSMDETREKDIGSIEQALQAAFPAYDLFRAFTSNIICKRLAERGIYVQKPAECLQMLVDEGYTEVVIQPTNLIHGEEFEQKIMLLKETFADRFQRFNLGRPLITTEEDFDILVAALSAQLPKLPLGESVVFMGHGSPHNNNKSFGYTYKKLQELFDKQNLPYLVGTVEDEDTPNLTDVLRRLQERGYHKVHMYPLMVVSGDHASNDMYGDEPDSWKSQIEALGIQTEGHLNGIGRYKSIQNIYIMHTLFALTKL